MTGSAMAKFWCGVLRRLKLVGPALLLASLPVAAQSSLQLSPLFGDHMVLQRGQPIRVWGNATPGDTVRVHFRGRQAQAKANAQGRWLAQLPPSAAGGPFELRVEGSRALSLRDVMVGDVWLASGQSNMEWSVADAMDAAAEVAAAQHPNIRHIKVAHHAALQPAGDISTTAGWRRAEPAHVGSFSAAAYYFARQVHRATGVPIGIVNASWGGTHIETWTSPTAALRDPVLSPIVQALPADRAAFMQAAAERMRRQVEQFQGPQDAQVGVAAGWSDASLDDRHWRKLRAPTIWEEQGLPGLDGHVWFRREVELSAEQAAGTATLNLGMVDDCDETWVQGQRVGGLCGWDTPRSYPLPPGLLRPGKNFIAVRVADTGGGGGFHGEAKAMRLQTAAGDVDLSGAWRARVEAVQVRSELHANDLPTLAYNGMVQPLLQMPLRGVLWYQGESNVPRAAAYVAAFQNLIQDWRAQWRQPDLPFYFVQLASYLPLEKNTLRGSSWAELRDAQQQALALPHTGMVVATDVGDANDIHPRNKQEVGRRLALLALADSYLKLGQRASESSGPVPSAVEVRGAEVHISFKHTADQLAARDGQPLRGFAIAGANQQFVPAQARIEGRRVIVSSPAVAEPLAVRHGWVDNPSETNLVGGTGLPASPFRTDQWPLVTQGVVFKR